MKKAIVIFYLALSPIIAMSQDMPAIDSLKCRIAHCDSLIQNGNRKRLNIDSLLIHIGNYRNLLDMICEREKQTAAKADSISCNYDILRQLTVSDTSIFNTDTPYNLSAVPLCLHKHISVINHIISIKAELSDLENKIDKIQTGMEGLQYDLKEVVQSNFIDNILKIDSYLTELEKMDISTLSTEQTEYYKPGLTSRYNSLIKYFN